MTEKAISKLQRVQEIKERNKKRMESLDDTNLADKPIRSLPIIKLFIDLIEQNMDITSAWLDNSYHYCLSDEARAFKYYAYKDIQDPRFHFPWWDN